VKDDIFSDVDLVIFSGDFDGCFFGGGRFFFGWKMRLNISSP